MKSTNEVRQPVLKAGIWYTISNILVKGVTLLIAPIFNRLMTQTEVGLFSNVQSWAGILVIICTFELSSSINIAKYDYKDDFDSYITSTVALGTLITSIFFVIYLTFQSAWESFLGMEREYIYILFVYFLLSPATSIYIEKHRSSLEYRQTILLSAGSSIAVVFISLALVLLMNDKLLGRVIGSYITVAAFGCLSLFMILKDSKSVKKKYWKYALAISFPLMFHLLAGNILSSSDRIIITKICGASDNALYSVAYLIATIVIIIWNSINSAWAPWSFMQFDAHNYKPVNKYSKVILVVAAIAIVLITALGPEVLWFLGGEKYVEAKSAIPPIMAGIFTMVVYTFYVNVEQFNKKQIVVAIGTIVAGAVNVILNILFIPLFGYVAAAYTTLAGYLVLFVIHFFTVRNMRNCDEIYDSKFMLFSLLFGNIAIISCRLLYDVLWIRVLIIALIMGILAITAIIKRENILLAIKNKSISYLFEERKK